MLVRQKGKDIVAAIGGIGTVEAAMSLFEQKMDGEQFAKIKTIKNSEVLLKIANAIAMCDPEKIFINTGSDADKAFVRQLSIEQGEEKPLAMKDHTIHFDLPEEQGRIVDRSYYIINEGENISSLAKKMLRDEALANVQDRMTGIMKGRTMLIGFFMRGPAGSPASNPALEITSSAYVMHSANILYRLAFDGFDEQVEKLGHFYANIHSQGENRPEDLVNARVYMDRSWWTTYSFFCTYAGNTLLMKKGNHRFTVDKSVYEGGGKALSEHMFITGIKGGANERVTWIVGAAPSGCGKTTTAMAGDLFVGDDLAQMWIADDGSIRSVNPENGIFGIVRDVNWDGDPQLMELLRNEHTEVIWSNVLVKDDVPHWTGNGEEHPKDGFNFQGEWTEGKTDANGKLIPISHPNARCTVAASALANYSEECQSPDGVLTRVITYSGRDSDTMPPVWVAKSSDEGVAIGACIVSAATATEVGATGVKRAPWANAPFIPGALGDYMAANFNFFGNDAIADEYKPVMAGLNYFLTEGARGGEGNKLLGEKRDVKVWLGWLERLAHGEVETIETPIGYIPKYDDLKALFAEILDKPYDLELYDKQFSLYIDNIVARIDLQIDAYGKEADVPEKLFTILKSQREGLITLKERFSSVVTPDQLF